MKIRKNHIQLFVLLFAVSSLLVHSPPEAFAAEEGDITAVRAKILGNHLEHHGHGAWTSLVHLDSDTYVLAFQSGINRSGISTFTISPDGSTITELDFMQHDTSNSGYNSLVKVDSDTVALAYRSLGSGTIKTFDIDSDGDITLADSLKHTTGSGGFYNSLVHVASDTFALAYQDSSLWMATFTINSDGDITAVRTETNSDPTARAFSFSYGSGGSYPSMVQVDSDTYAVAHTGRDSDGFITTFNISSDGTTIAEEDVLEHDTHEAIWNSLVKVDSDTFALAYKHGYSAPTGSSISTFTIESDGDITAVMAHSDGSGCCANNQFWHTNAAVETWSRSFVQMDSDTFALSLTHGSTGGGYITTFNISSDGNTITKLDTLQHDTDAAARGSILKLDSDTVAIAYYGNGVAGIISTFTISIEPTVTSSGGSSDDLINPKPYLTDEILVSVGPNKPIVTQSDGMSNIQIQKGDNITITLNAADDTGPVLETNTFSGQSEIESVSLYTNFGPRPSGMNLYHANHFNDKHETSKTFYEWYKYKDDVIYDFENNVSWAEAVVTTEDKFTISITDTDTETTSSTEGKLTITFSATWNEVMPKSEIIVKAVDSNMGYSTTTLPFTIQVGEYDQSYEDLFGTSTGYRFVPLITESNVRESIEQWVDPFSGMTDEKFVSSLGLHGDELPEYVKYLAQWVVEDKIDLADLIIAVEYIINVK